MKLIHQLCILLLINFAACSTEQEDPCNDDNMKYRGCFQKHRNVDDMFSDLNATNDDTLRSDINRYCEVGIKYLQCVEGITLTAQCEESDFLPTKNRVFAEKIRKFAVKYLCQNDGEAMFKIAANNGLQPFLSPEMGETIRGCFPASESSDYSKPRSEIFCRDVDAVSGCLLESTDKMANQDISGSLRDVIPQLKVIGNCAAAA